MAGRTLCPSKTQWAVFVEDNEDNENNRAQKYPLQGGGGFNQVLILIAICDYDEEK